MLVIDPTHKDGDLLSEKLRELRKAKGLITGDEKAFPRLTALGWTDAQKGDAGHYRGDEVIQFFRNSGPFKAGDRVKASELLPHLPKRQAGAFRGVWRGRGQVRRGRYGPGHRQRLGRHRQAPHRQWPHRRDRAGSRRRAISCFPTAG